MLLALKSRFVRLVLVAILSGAVLPGNSESQAQRLVANGVSPSSLDAAPVDPTRDALLTLGSEGAAIQQARTEVLAMLSDTNSCSAWFQTAEPRVWEKFRSLEFAVDQAGAGEILKLASWRDDGSFYQPYVARTGQNVGWGSTVTLNENGAFFRKVAPVRIVVNFDDKGYFKSSRPLAVGGYGGATLPARIVALLHELGHVVNLLPIDSGVPSGPSISVQNTEKVLHYCGGQIRSHKKPSRINDTATILSAAAPMSPDSFGIKPRSRGASLQ